MFYCESNRSVKNISIAILQIVLRLRPALFLAMDSVGDLDGLIDAHNRYLGQLEKGLFLNDESMVKMLLFSNTLIFLFYIAYYFYMFL